MMTRLAHLAAIGFVLAVSSAQAFATPDIEPREQFQTADMVVIGVATSDPRKTHRVRWQGNDAEYVSMKIATEVLLKGFPAKTFDFEVSGPISETNPQCCDVGGKYLLFLHAVGNNYYQALYGPKSVFRLDNNDPTN
jgi:hypothetical protein